MRINRRFSEIMLGLFLLFIGASALVEGGNVFMTVLVLAGIFMLVRQFESGRQGGSRQSRQQQDYIPPREQSSEQNPERKRIYHHALAAVEAAGHDAENIKVLTTDIGLLAFKEEQDPVVYRSRDILDDVDYIQPYVQLRLPTPASGLIRFEIIDSTGESVFVHEERHQLKRDRNLITPAARLPVHDALLLQGSWELRVSADGVPLAIHEFSWEESTSKVVRRHLSEDGEISSELRAAIAENRLQKLSLDELLDFQDDESAAQQRS
jgi:hypothetical protein